ncbi:MAG: hypothetical protein IPH59_16090 [bacterium]|nr:hypothetical protein [bacterium]
MSGLEILVNLAGVLGLALSILVFILTRWERRRRLTLVLVKGDTSKFPKEIEGREEDQELIVLQIVNEGARPLIIDAESLQISVNQRSIRRHDCDWLGIDSIPVPLNPRTSCNVALYLESFEELSGLIEHSDLRKVDSPEECVFIVKASVKNIEGKKYATRHDFQYSALVSEFWNRNG